MKGSCTELVRWTCYRVPLVIKATIVGGKIQWSIDVSLINPPGVFPMQGMTQRLNALPAVRRTVGTITMHLSRGVQAPVSLFTGDPSTSATGKLRVSSQTGNRDQPDLDSADNSNNENVIEEHASITLAPSDAGHSDEEIYESSRIKSQTATPERQTMPTPPEASQYHGESPSTDTVQAVSTASPKHLSKAVCFALTPLV